MQTRQAQRAVVAYDVSAEPRRTCWEISWQIRGRRVSA